MFEIETKRSLFRKSKTKSKLHFPPCSDLQFLQEIGDLKSLNVGIAINQGRRSSVEQTLGVALANRDRPISPL
jgi:hypothetical protein